jgi:hypothetical protein
VTPKDDKLCGFGCFDERAGWSIANEVRLHSHVGIAFLPSRQRLVQKARFFCLYCRPMIRGENAYDQVPNSINAGKLRIGAEAKAVRIGRLARSTRRARGRDGYAAQ